MNRKKQLINEIADLVLDKLDEESKIGRRIKHAFSYAKSRLLKDDFDFLSIAQDLDHNKFYAKKLIRLIDLKDYSYAYGIATRLYEIITEAFKEIGFVPRWVKPPQAKYTHRELSRRAVILSILLHRLIVEIKDPGPFSITRIQRDADRIVRYLIFIISILETLKTENK